MTIDELIDRLLTELDAAYADLRAVHEDRVWVNPNNEYRKRLEKITELSTAVFEAKCFVDKMERLTKK